jgi:hypothetical protein
MYSPGCTPDAAKLLRSYSKVFDAAAWFTEELGSFAPASF